MMRSTLRLGLLASAVALAVVSAGAATAQEVTSIAIMVPEQGTDYGWNQQGVDAARAVAESSGPAGRNRLGSVSSPSRPRHAQRGCRRLRAQHRDRR